MKLQLCLFPGVSPATILRYVSQIQLLASGGCPQTSKLQFLKVLMDIEGHSVLESANIAADC